jgi:transposase
MTKPYSVDLRERVVGEVMAGRSVRAVAAVFSVSPSFVVKLTQAWRATGTVAARRQGGDRRSAAIEAHGDRLLALVRETPDLTLAEIRDRLNERGVSASITAIWRFYRRHGVSFKKNRARRRAGAGGRGRGADGLEGRPARP